MVTFLAGFTLLCACGKNGARSGGAETETGGVDRDTRPLSGTAGGSYASALKRAIHQDAGGLDDREKLTELFRSVGTAEECIALLEAADKTLDGQMRLEALASGLSRLVELGHIDEAWSWLPEGQGAARNQLLGAMFRGMHADKATFDEAFARLEFKSEKKAALSGFIAAIADLDSLDGVEFAGLPLDEFNMRPSLHNALLNFARSNAEGLGDSSMSHGERSRRAAEAFRVAEQLVEAGEIDQWVLVHLTRGMHSGDTVGALQAIEDLRLFTSPGAMREVRNELLREMMLNDPVAAMEFAKNLEHPRVIPALTQWLAVDADAAGEWYLANIDSFNEEERSRAATQFVGVALGQGEFDVSREWLDQVTIEADRQRLSDNIWHRERQEAHREAARDPGGFVAAIVTGDTAHGHHSIEPAFTEWLNQDLGAAEDWYNTNSSSLTPEQHGPVAFAFAKRAVGEGDLDVAREWAEHVTGEVARQRLDRMIRRAETP